MKKTALFIASVMLFIISCKKDKDSNVPHNVSVKHFPITAGSYWIYESITLDTFLNVISTGDIDSVYISNDTIINGKIYSQKRSVTLIGGGGSYFLESLGPVRDSLGYLVSPNGQYIKHDDFTSILNWHTSTTPLYTKISKMVNKDSLVTVPAGAFFTSNYQDKIIFEDPSYPFPSQKIKYNNMLWANNVGLVFRNSSFYMGFNTIGIRLIRYHIAS